LAGCEKGAIQDLALCLLWISKVLLSFQLIVKDLLHLCHVEESVWWVLYKWSEGSGRSVLERTKRIGKDERKMKGRARGSLQRKAKRQAKRKEGRKSTMAAEDDFLYKGKEG